MLRTSEHGEIQLNIVTIEKTVGQFLEMVLHPLFLACQVFFHSKPTAMLYYPVGVITDM